MYINIYKIALLVCICGIGIFGISCSGNTDDSEQTEVILSVSKNSLIADGKDVITFTVMYAGIDVTADAVIRSVMDGQTLDGSTFSTSKAGTYAFEASYDKYVSKLMTVVAKSTSGTLSRFVRRICAMEFTGTWCAMCPAGMTRLNYLINSDYEGIVYLMSFHVNGTSADPMAIEQTSIISKKFAIPGYPSCVVDMRKEMGLSENYTVMRSIFNESLEKYPVHCGVAISSLYNEAGSEAKVTVRVTPEKTADYRLIVYAVEDGLKYEQNDGGNYRDYTHNHVVRKLLSASVDGDKLGQLPEDKEVMKEYTVILDNAWKAEKLSFYALVTDENGYVNNLAVCEAINGNADYEYVND